MKTAAGRSMNHKQKETILIICFAALLILVCAIITTLMMRDATPRTVAEAKSEVTDVLVIGTKQAASGPYASTETTTVSTTVTATTSQTLLVSATAFMQETKKAAVSMTSEQTVQTTEVTVLTKSESAVQETAASATEAKTGMTAEPETKAAEQKPAENKTEVSVSSVTYRGKTFSTAQKELNLSGFKMTKEQLPELKEIAAKFQNLEKIIFSDCGLSNEVLAAFNDEMGSVRVVWRVKLGTQWSLRTDSVAFSVLIMNYKHIRMTSKDLEVLKYCPDLLALDLGHQALTDLSKIAEYLPDLRLLIIADNQVSDLSPLANLKHLHYLEIFVNRVKDLSPLANLHELVDVNISYNPVSDITPLLNSPMMQRVWLESTKVNQSGVDLLRSTYPNAKVVNIGKGSVDQGWRWGNARYEQMMNMWYNNYYGNEFQKYDDLAVQLGLRG
jgi:hypothetical protein